MYLSHKCACVQINAVAAELCPVKFRRQFPGGKAFPAVDETGRKGKGTDEGFGSHVPAQLSQIQIPVPLAQPPSVRGPEDSRSMPRTTSVTPASPSSTVTAS